MGAGAAVADAAGVIWQKEPEGEWRSTRAHFHTPGMYPFTGSVLVRHRGPLRHVFVAPEPAGPGTEETADLPQQPGPDHGLVA
ncbi:hypothetical protein [Georgenia sp. AZ-5]|uniref:hypothetical protein n=1 Tax=Georgenia sp. AZ-5 TaxID=3367526 RepID=UPI0037541DA5